TVLIVLALSAGLSAQTTSVTDMASHVFAVTGAAPRECGRHPLRQSGRTLRDPSLAELQASLQCVRQAIAARQSFWTFVQRRGIDSYVAHGLLGTADGAVRWFGYDSAPCGNSSCQGELTLEPCADPIVQTPADDAPDFSCRGW